MNRGQHGSRGWSSRSNDARRAPRSSGGGGGPRSGFRHQRGQYRRGGAEHHRVFVGGDRTGASNGGVPVNLSFGNFTFQEMENIGQRGGGVRELSSLLRQARRRAADQKEQLRTREGIEERKEYLLSTAMQRAAGQKIKDDPTKLSKALAKRRSKKRQSAKKWAKRLKNLEDSVENVVKDRSIAKQTARARKEAKTKAKEKRKSAIKGLKVGAGGKAKGGKAKGGKGKGGKGKGKAKGGGGWGKVK